ncbi:MAG: hypothetical protein ACU0BF_01285 [Paracoccaceae bacterium]
MRAALLAATALLAACAGGAPLEGGVRVGMDRLEVAQALGTPTEIHILEDERSCISYGEDTPQGPRFVHAVFDGLTLVGTSAGNPGLCSGAA